jgi:hypothetical protein
MKLKYHHIGIPTDKDLPAEDFMPEFGSWASGFEKSPYGIEWMKFNEGSPLPELVKKVPHVAFVTDNLAEAIAGKEILIEPNSHTKGITVAFIVDNGAPVEFLQFDNPENEVWPVNAIYR